MTTVLGPADVRVWFDPVTRSLRAQRVDRPRAEIPADESWEITFPRGAMPTLAEVLTAFRVWPR